MNYIKNLVLPFILVAFPLTNFFGQQTYMPAAQKMSKLLETKLLKTGDLVLVEKVRYCDYTHVKILKPDGSEELILYSGLAKFIAFNELPDNNWVLVIITDPEDDYPVPYTFHTIAFVEDQYTIFNTDDDQTMIPLQNISGSAVINDSELVLKGLGQVHFTDFQLSVHEDVIFEKDLSFIKSITPGSNQLYFRYGNDDEIRATNDKFETEEVISSNLGDTFRNIHYLGDYTIIQNEEEISVSYDMIDFYYLDQNKKIYGFRQHGQNLTYHTIDMDNMLTLNKIYLDESTTLKKDSLLIDLNSTYPIQKLHWDGDFKGYNFLFVPLSSQNFDDDYRGFNYVLNYSFENDDLTTQNIDVSIDNIEYTSTVDTASNDVQYFADIQMQISVSNNTDELISDVHLHSAAFEGVNCAHNGLKVDDNIITLAPNETKVINARYESLQFNTPKFLQHPLCIYIIGANNSFDDNFNDNIYCLPLKEFTSTKEDNYQTGFDVYPNPANSSINIKSVYSNSTYDIFTSDGELVFTHHISPNENKIDISSLKTGSYLILERRSGRISFFNKI